MPEGDAIRRLAGTITELFEGGGVVASSPQGRFAASAARIDGKILQAVRVHGKHMFIGFVAEGEGEGPPEEWMHIHLGLYGWWRFNGDETVVDEGYGVAHRVPPVPAGEWNGHSETRWGEGFGEAEAGTWEPPEPVGQVRFRMYNAHAVADLVGPNRCELITDAEREAVEARLGPDPLERGARDDEDAAARFAETAHAKKRAIGEIVMDQSIIAGVGNIYRADALFLAGISPHRKGANVSVKRLKELWVLICDLMNRGLAAGRLETMDPDEAPDPPLEGDEEASRWYVYHRTGRPCLRCGTPIREALMQNRRLFWCPSCQR
ncbi:Fpg/Nei family DNA glycosylase [Schaalia hyovaginalis]|uniref:DNA-(apurinic or apyrimidinic site) lyase n=1 Tax=Schaalia hyovaginalis TaxID=29316 RepID=A0A923E4V0_9ACTO|nr:DNA-formamidopyrimidine glycosylase family protein [Schaalia hyovaginalis]MBB6334908.1 endonuclease-8 [Schaalia hyovaginalis]MDY2668587.1 Fpg/Nei family DNA glycosylase [Schaalia hyovaginalis]